MPKQTRVYMGVDPGTANTGVAVCIKQHGVVRMLHGERILTTPKQKDRQGIVRKRLRELALQYNVTDVVCENYEVRTYQGAMKQGVAMCKLINAISEEFFAMGLPFVLQSPKKKKGVAFADFPTTVQKQLNAMKKTHREHVQDAYLHVYVRLRS